MKRITKIGFVVIALLVVGAAARQIGYIEAMMEWVSPSTGGWSGSCKLVSVTKYPIQLVPEESKLELAQELTRRAVDPQEMVKVALELVDGMPASFDKRRLEEMLAGYWCPAVMDAIAGEFAVRFTTVELRAMIASETAVDEAKFNLAIQNGLDRQDRLFSEIILLTIKPEELTEGRI